MRERKYRAWADGKMHYPTEKMWWYIAPNGYWSLNIGDGLGEIICDSLESKDAELMDFIGLKDKNGKEIYEGDVIQGNLIKYSPLPTMGTIVWDKEFASFANQNEAGNTLLFEIDRIKIIGNIYENPELKGE